MTSQPPIPAAATSPYPLNAAPPSALMGADIDDDANEAFDEEEFDAEEDEHDQLPLGAALGILGAVAALALSVAGGVLLARNTSKKKKPAGRRKAKRRS